MATAADKVPVVCPNCNKRLLVPAGTLGKQGRCPACQTVFRLEQLWEAEPVSASPPTAPLAPFSPFSQPASPFGAPASPPPNSQAGFAAAGNPWGNTTPAPAANAWGAPAQPAANPWGTPAQASKSPYDDADFQADYQLQAAPPVAVNPYASPMVTPLSTSSTYQRPKEKGEFWSSSVIGGIALMLIAVVWFVGGLAVNIIFFYPPILFLIGLVAFFKGIFGGNLAGE
jgi:hypothetical protein